MTVTRRLLGVSVIAALAVGSLGACMPVVPMPTPTPTESRTATPTRTPTPTPTPTEEPIVLSAERIVVDATTLTVYFEGSDVVAKYPFSSDGELAAEEIGDALGVAPTISELGESSCRSETMVYDWPGLRIEVPGVVTMAPGAVFTATLTAPTTSNGVGLFAPFDQRVGSSASGALAANPEAISVDLGSGIFVGLDVGAIDGVDTWGALGITEGGTITKIVTPIYFYGDC